VPGNIAAERLRGSLKYEDIYLKDYRSMEEVKAGLKRYFAFYNGRRYHASLEYRTPDEVYASAFKEGQAEAGPLVA
jgi:putative transposase